MATYETLFLATSNRFHQHGCTKSNLASATAPAVGSGARVEQWSFSSGIWTWREKREVIFPSWMADLVTLGRCWWSWLPRYGRDKGKKLEREREGSSAYSEMWIDEKQREAYWVSNFSSSSSWEPAAFLSQGAMRQPSIILNYHQWIFEVNLD